MEKIFFAVSPMLLILEIRCVLTCMRDSTESEPIWEEIWPVLLAEQKTAGVFFFFFFFFFAIFLDGLAQLGM